MNKTQILTKAYDIEKTWKNFVKKRRECESHGRPISPEDENYLSASKREKMFEDFIYLFWLLTGHCFKEDEELKKLAFVASKSKRLSQ